MSKDNNVRNYKFSDAELIVFVQHVIDCVSRDIVQFSEYNVNENDLNLLQTLCNDFKEFPTDDYLNMDYQSATQSKEELLFELRRIVKKMAMRVEMLWGKNSAKYKSLNISDITIITDESFIQRARLIYLFLLENQEVLETEGLTTIMLDDMNRKIQDLEDAKHIQINKASLRIEKTIERKKLGNEIYNYAAKYCEVGKRIWDGIHSSFYNDYVIYSKKSSNKKPNPDTKDGGDEND